MSTSGIKRSHSKDDTSSSLRDSGISISDEPTESDGEVSNVVERKRKRRRNISGHYVCAVCGKKFGGGTDLRRHLLIHTNEKPYECEICHKAYRQEVNLKIHMKVTHSDEKEFICRFCRKPFPLKQRLRLHLRLHTGEKPYSCPICPKTFARGGQLQQHLTTHDECKKKTCELCNSTFSSERNLKLHMERHKGEQKDICQICKKIFTTDKSMRAHLASVHAKVTEFECQICETTIKEDMQTHMKTHEKVKSHECEVCKSVFAVKAQYRIHMRIHTGERPYQCRVCWQSFGHNNVLKLHIRKHTGEKPFKCLLCKDSHTAFSQLSHLKTHMKSIHKKDNSYVCEGCKECFKAKFHLENHMQACAKVLRVKTEPSEGEKTAAKDVELLANLRYLIAVLLKKISTKEKLAKLGFEKRLIDNVLIASLKLANRNCFESKKINELDRMKLNIQEFLEWIVPAEVMDGYKRECPSIESILDKIVAMYMKKVE